MQGRGCCLVGLHAIDSCAAVASVFGAVGGIDGSAKLGLVTADVLNGDTDLEARHADPRASRVEDTTEPPVVPSVPGPYVHTWAGSMRWVW
jgi:hypothetical protein